MSEFGEREACDFFGHLAVLNIDERNDLDEYLRGLPEFKEWDEAGFLLGVKQKLFRASARAGGTPVAVDEVCEQLRLAFRKYRDLHDALRRKAKAWCRAMAEEPA